MSERVYCPEHGPKWTDTFASGETRYAQCSYARRPPDGNGPRSLCTWREAVGPALTVTTRVQRIGVDLDGTLAVFLDNDQIGPPIPKNIDKCLRLAGQGWQIDIFTSRPWHQYDLIAAFCNTHGVPWSEIQCGKPLYAAYVDDKAINADDTDWTPRPA